MMIPEPNVTSSFKTVTPSTVSVPDDVRAFCACTCAPESRTVASMVVPECAAAKENTVPFNSIPWPAV